MQKEVKLMSLPVKTPERDDVVLEKYCNDRHGFMRINVMPSKIIGEYFTVPNPHESWHDSLNPNLYDTFEIALSQK